MSALATSARDPRVVRAARLLRDERFRAEERAFVVDGEDLVREALAAGLRAEAIFRGGGAAAAAAAAAIEIAASADVMRALSAVGEVPSVVAVFAEPAAPPLDLPPRSLVLCDVRDAGNVGSIVRTAAALRLPRVTLTPGCGDPWSRKALRASMGASFAPGLVARDRSLEELAALAGRPPLAAAVPRGGVAADALPPGAVVVLGAERDGLAPGERALCDLPVSVPAGGFESLNVAAAAAILSWEIARR